MGIVRFALKFPYTFYVLATLVVFLGGTSIVSMPTDIFPEIRIPVVTIVWQYTGLSTPEMEQRVTTYSQFALSSSVNGIRDIEAQTLNGISVQKVFFQPDVNLDLAIAQIVSATNSIRALLPPGIQAPVVVQYNASSVPVLQIGLSSDTLNEQQLYDYGIYRLRQQLAPIHGVTLPTPAGGKYRQIMVDLDPLKLQAKGLTPIDIVNAVNAQNLTVPSGLAKIGDTQFTVRTNAVPTSIDDLNNIPVKFAGGATVFVKDVGQVHDGNAVQQNIVRTDGRRRQCGQAGVGDLARRGARRHGDQGTVRSIGVREEFDRGAAQGRRDRGRSHRADDPAVSRILALHPGRDGGDPAVDPVVADLPQLPRRDHQHHDAGRACAGDRHPGRRFHGHDREHPSPPDREGDAAAVGDPAWRGRDRGADAGVDPGDQLRVHVGGVPRRPGKIPFYAAWACRGVR